MWTMVASAVLVAIAAFMLIIDLSVIALAIVLYGAGNGIGSIARGTVPLALFGSGPYPVLMGRLAFRCSLQWLCRPSLAAWHSSGAELNGRWAYSLQSLR